MPFRNVDFKNINIKNLKRVDYIIITFICLLLLIVGLVFVGKNKFSKTRVLAKENVAFQVYFRGITVTDMQSPFQVGAETFITIRNVPYTKLKIVDVKFDRRQKMIPANNKNKFVLVNDLTVPFNYDFVVTLVDQAKITPDGAVVGGNKLKIGIPIVLEGPNYKLRGVISNVGVIKQNNKKDKDEATK